MITAEEVTDALVLKLKAAGFPLDHETVTSAQVFEILKTVAIIPNRTHQVPDSGEGRLMGPYAALQNICRNAVLAPDVRMNNATDCYLVPLDDIEAANELMERAVSDDPEAPLLVTRLKYALWQAAQECRTRNREREHVTALTVIQRWENLASKRKGGL